MSYKVGDKVLFEAEIKENAGAGAYKIDMLGIRNLWINENDIQGKVKTYEDGLADAWKVLKHIQSGELSSKEIMDIWGMTDLTFVNCFAQKYTPQEALKILEVYEKSHIEVGDVVEIGGNLAVVVSFGTFKVKDDSIHVVYFDGVTNCLRKDNKSIKKTGRHIDIEHLLEQIRGDE